VPVEGTHIVRRLAPPLPKKNGTYVLGQLSEIAQAQTVPVWAT
jgi:hypothetical protein